MDAPVGDQLFKRYTRHLSSYRIKSRKCDSLGGIVDDKLNSGESFELLDISAFAPDDPAFHFFSGQRNGGYGCLGNLIRGTALNGK